MPSDSAQHSLRNSLTATKRSYTLKLSARGALDLNRGFRNCWQAACWRTRREPHAYLCPEVSGQKITNKDGFLIQNQGLFKVCLGWNQDGGPWGAIERESTDMGIRRPPPSKLWPRRKLAQCVIKRTGHRKSRVRNATHMLKNVEPEVLPQNAH